jgi:hypothetical protein
MMVIKYTFGLWLTWLALSVVVGVLPISQAQQTPVPSPSPSPSPAPAAAKTDTVTKPTERLGYIGGALGVSSAGNNVGTGLGYGGDLAFFPKTYIGVGGVLRGAQHGTPSSGLYLGQVILRPTSPLQFAFLLGAGDLNDAGTDTGNDLAYGGKVSYDIQLGDTIFTLGPEIDLVSFKPGARSITFVNVLASFKIWL